MLKARKGNRVVRIPDEKQDAYIALGYSITDMDGNMLHEHVEPTEKLEKAEKEIEDLKAKLEEASKYAEKADKKIEDLEKKNTEYEKEIEELKSEMHIAASEDTAPEEEKKSATKKKTKADSDEQK